jgi:hypothetical protein
VERSFKNSLDVFLCFGFLFSVHHLILNLGNKLHYSGKHYPSFLLFYLPVCLSFFLSVNGVNVFVFFPVYIFNE